jgi:hypothetical protein
MEQAVKGAQLHRLDGHISPPGCGYYDDGDARVDTVDLLEELHYSPVRQTQVKDNDIECMRADVLQPKMDRMGDPNPMHGRGERLAQLLRQDTGVIAENK